MEKNKKNKGFTLIELLVAVTVFTLVVGVAVDFFIYAVQSQRRVLAYQEVLDQTSFIIEYIARDIRMAKKQRGATDPMTCLPTGNNYELVGGRTDHIRMIGWDHLVPFPHFVCFEIRLNGTILEKSRDRGLSWTRLTSPRLEVIRLRFDVIGDRVEGSLATQLQPRVTMALEVRGREYALGGRPTIQLQTTISQRDPDI